MKRHLFFHKRNVCAVAGLFVILFAAVNSSFTMPRHAVRGGGACNGPFYSNNILGSGFSILSPGTGAPDNAGNCSGCHTTYADNSGDGVLTIEVGNGDTMYFPGQTYPVKVTLTQAGISAMDFQLTTRDDSSGTQVSGIFSLTDPSRTKLTNGNFGGAGNKYVEGTACGIDVLSNGYNEWHFNWKAPVKPAGNITFYVGAVAANFNNQNSGDYTYSKTLVLSELSTVGLTEGTAAANVSRVFPNPATDHVSVDYSLAEGSRVVIKMTDMQGRESVILFNDYQSYGDHHQRFELDRVRFAPGVYLLQVISECKVIAGKMVCVAD